MTHTMSIDRSGSLNDAVAEAAATYLRERQSEDFDLARAYAQRKLGVGLNASAPDNREIARALHRQLEFFQPEQQKSTLKRLREVALEAMEFFADYDPRLVGSALDGTANAHSPVVLHVFADTVEEVIFYLQDNNVPHDLADRRVQTSGRQPRRTVPVLTFVAGDTPLEVYVFDYDSARQAPPCPISGKPMKRASKKQVVKLLAA